METNKHAGGRPPKFKTPEELEAKAEEYFRWCDANPVRIYQRKNAGASQTAEKGRGVKSDEGEMFVDRPYIIEGLCRFIGVADWQDFRSYHADDEFSVVIHAIDMRIREQQLTGGLCCVYHPNLTARINGIADTQNINTNIPVKIADDGLD